MKSEANAIRTRRRGLSALARSTSGNAMFIAAIAMIPIIGMVGSAFDIGRAYMVKTRLQQACDAGALAGRRAMTTASFDTDTAAKQQANSLFFFNFPRGSFGTDLASLSFSPVGTNDGQVRATAGVTVPMTLMQLFNTPAADIAVECEAKLEIANTDIMFVLDVTGSMNCAVGQSGSCNNNEVTYAKIKALRTAVVDFYDTIDTAVSNEARLRFGFVPYSSTVNVGYLLPSGYLVDENEYQSRQRQHDRTYTTSTANGTWATTSTETSAWTQHSYTTNVRSRDCSAPSDTSSTRNTGSETGETTTSDEGVITTTSSQTRTVTNTEYNRTYTATSDKRGNCLIERRTVVQYQSRTTTETKTPNYVWQYAPVKFDTSQFKLGNAVSTRTGNNFSMESSSWNGCIEERSTLAQASFSYPIDSGAIDLDIDRIPDNDASRWRPSWPDIIWNRKNTDTALSSSNGNDTYYQPTGSCPKQASRLAEMTRSQIETYVSRNANFRATGNTYHDAGMIWGARLISPTGIFQADNAAAPNGKPISRHIIFMTDGEMQPSSSVYSLYGLERLDERVSGGNTNDLTARHNSRFLAVCDAIKAKNISIWVVAYSQSLTSELRRCADSGRAFEATNDQQLKDQFKQIASKIAELRLAK